MEGFKDYKAAVIDDDQVVCEFLTKSIRSRGLHAKGFTDPCAALEDIGRNGCDIILLDVDMGDMCGLDLIPQLDGNLKIIVITGYADKDTAIRALKLGAFDLLEKPFQQELLYHSLSRALTALENERQSKRLMEDLKQNRLDLLDQQERLENLSAKLVDTNRAISIFAQNIEREREEVERRIACQLRKLIIPVVVRLGNDPALHNHKLQLDMLTRQIENLASGFEMDSSLTMRLSDTELQVASFVKNGMTTEEIAWQLHVAGSTVRTHRKNIRKKLKINNAQFSLRNFLNEHSG